MPRLVLVVVHLDAASDPSGALDALPADRRVLVRSIETPPVTLPADVELTIAGDGDRARVAARVRASADELVVVLTDVERPAPELTAALVALARDGEPGVYAAATRFHFLGRDIVGESVPMAWLGERRDERTGTRVLRGELVTHPGSVAATIERMEALAARVADGSAASSLADFIGRPIGAAARRMWRRRRDGVPGMILSILETYGEVLAAAQSWERGGMSARRAAIRRGAPPGFHVWLTPRGWLTLRDGTSADLREALLDATPQAVSGEALEGGRGSVWALPLGDGGRGVLRWYRRGGLFRKLLQDRYFGRPPRPMIELAVTEEVRRRGVAAAEVLAARVDRLALGWYRGAILTRELAGVETFAEALRRRPAGDARAELLTAVGRAVRDLHERHVHHRDLNAGNILVRQNDDGYAVHFIDFDRADVASTIPAWIRHRALRRLERSLAKLSRTGVTIAPEDVAALRRAYGVEA